MGYDNDDYKENGISWNFLQNECLTALQAITNIDTKIIHDSKKKLQSEIAKGPQNLQSNVPVEFYLGWKMLWFFMLQRYAFEYSVNVCKNL